MSIQLTAINAVPRLYQAGAVEAAPPSTILDTLGVLVSFYYILPMFPCSTLFL